MSAPKQQDKNIIMCLSPGRCGTNLLALLLDLAADTHAVHEPVPGFHDLVDTLPGHPEQALPFVRDVKIPAIEAVDASSYVETSHLFGKGFFDAFIELDVAFSMIVLNRDPRAVARSLRRVKAIPARSPKRAKYLLHPEHDGVMSLPGWQGMSNYQLCFWYALEMERRKDTYSAVCRKAGIKVSEIGMEDLLNFEILRGFAAGLGLDIPENAADAHAEITGRKVNRKGRYLPRPTLVSAARQEDAVWQALGDEGRSLYARLCDRYGWKPEEYPGSAVTNDMQQEIARGRSQLA